MTHEEIIAAVESMTVLELADLVTAMEEKFGVSAAAPVAVVAGGAAAGAAAAKRICRSVRNRDRAGHVPCPGRNAGGRCAGRPLP